MSLPSPHGPLASNGSHRTDTTVITRSHAAPSGRTILIRLAAITAVLAVAGFIVFKPVRFPSIVNSYAAITPVQKWVLAKVSDGQLVGSTFNYRSGMNVGYRVSTFNPGSSIYFSMHSTLTPGKTVSIGDTVGSIYSTEVQERLIALQGQLHAARSLLAVTATGQKSAIVDEAQQRLEFARRRSAEHERIETRTRKLFEQHLIAEGEWDRVQSEANALRDEIVIAAANLEAAKTGAKPEQLNLVNANISALQSEIDAVRRRASTYTVTAPISGTVSPTFSGDTLLTIAATEYVALLPIKASDYLRVTGTPAPRIRLIGLRRTPVFGTIVAMNRELLTLNGYEVAMATASLDAAPADLMPGMMVQCQVECRPRSVADLGRQALIALRTSRVLRGGF